MNTNVNFFKDLLAEANKRDGFQIGKKPKAVECMYCGNEWLPSLQSACDACGCKSWQHVEKDHVA